MANPRIFQGDVRHAILSGRGRVLKRLSGLAALSAGAPIVGAGLLGDLHRYFDVFSHLAWHGGGLALGGVAALLWPRRGLALLVAAVLLTIFVPPLAAHFVQRPLGPGAGPGSLKVMTFNTWHRNRTPSKVAELLERERPDVAVLVEFGPNKRHLLKRLSALYPYQTGCSEDRYCGVVLLSQRAMRNVGHEGRGRREGPPRTWGTIDFEGRALTIVGVHLMRPIDSPRRHQSEFRRLAAQVRGMSRQGDVIVAGDFNAVAWSASLSGFSRATGLQRMPGLFPSWPAPPRGLVQIGIDHVLASEGLEFRDVWLGPSTGSDHLPLLAIVGSAGK